MCGIFFILLQNDDEDLNKVNKNFKLLENRGPDRGKLIITKNYIAGFQRLCINDLSHNGDQPFYSKDHTILECNGEIFNYKELIDKYNIETISRSDCEVLIHLYNKLGIKKTVSELNGDYAFFINTPDKVHMVRDLAGVRPLFYGFSKNNNLCISSNARSLIDLCIVVKEVPPGILTFDKNRQQIYVTSERMINYPINQDTSFENMLIKSVKDRLLSNRPIGCLLSGGLDSSLIASILCRLIGKENVRTYSIGFENSNDLVNAEKVSKYLGTNHKSITINQSDIFFNLNNIIKDLESYDITTVRASAPMWLLARYIKENTEDVVLFSGEGADELFCGYLYFHYAPNNQELLKERLRLFTQMYKYDCLRADRCISSHGLEIRVPFLDKTIIQHAFSLDPDILCPKKNNNIEKFYIRNSFTEDYLPKEVLWRRKDGFSDGVTSVKTPPWYSYYETMEHDPSCVSREAQVYKEIYTGIFGSHDLKTPYWMPQWIDTNGDPSGRKLEIFKN
jgi:asparagine synthase (glutamine-hydrolysing)